MQAIKLPTGEEVLESLSTGKNARFNRLLREVKKLTEKDRRICGSITIELFKESNTFLAICKILFNEGYAQGAEHAQCLTNRAIEEIERKIGNQYDYTK